MNVLKLLFIAGVFSISCSFVWTALQPENELYQRFLKQFDHVEATPAIRLDDQRNWASEEKNRRLSMQFKDFIPSIGIGLGDRFGGSAVHEAEVLAKQTEEFDVLIYSMSEYYYPKAKSYYAAVFDKEGKALGRHLIASSDGGAYSELTISPALLITAKKFKYVADGITLASVETAQITKTGFVKSISYKSGEELGEGVTAKQD